MVYFKFQFDRLGPVQDSTMEFDGLTILTGENGTGKTYVASAIFSFFQHFSTGQALLQSQYRSDENALLDYSHDDFEQLLRTGEVEIDLEKYSDQVAYLIAQHASQLSKNFGQVFGVANTQFKDSVFSATIAGLTATDYMTGSWGLEVAGQLEFHRQAPDLLLTIRKLNSTEDEHLLWRMYIDGIARYLVDFIIRPTYFSTSERSGVMMFQNDIDISRSRLLESASSAEEVAHVFRSSRLPRTIISNLNLIRDAPTYLQGEYGAFAKNNPDIITELDALVGGKYIEVNKELHFDYGGSSPINMKIAASSIRSLFDLAVFLKYIAQPGAVLMIDEPELNLHPRNQVRLARLLVRLVKAGLRIFISTHSDYIIREIGLCTMLSDTARQVELEKEETIELASDYGDGAKEVDKDFALRYFLDASQVRAYQTRQTSEGVTIEAMEMTASSGASMPVFDDVITTQNQRLDFVEWGINEAE